MLSLTTFGESHGPATGGVIDGLPSGLFIDDAFIRSQLRRRNPEKLPGSTSRDEPDKVQWLSGLLNNKTTGAPLGFIVENKDFRPQDYALLKDIFRPSHADYAVYLKYGVYPMPGGGRASGRETVARVVAGTVAKTLLKKYRVDFLAYVSGIGGICARVDQQSLTSGSIQNALLGCPDPDAAEKMHALIQKTSAERDTLGGTVSCVIRNVPTGLGEPVFDKLQADLAKAMLSIPSVKGFEYGSGFGAAVKKGSEHNDALFSENGNIHTRSNNDGGIQGGISTGNVLCFRVAFKPVPSHGKKQRTVDLRGKPVEIQISGRHDVCIVPRAAVVVESMAALTLADHVLRFNARKH